MSNLLQVILTILIYTVICEAAKCDGKTCAQCIGESVNCVWCSAQNHNGTRCQPHNMTNPFWCSEKVDNPGHDQRHINVKRNDSISAEEERVVQLAPQELKMTLRPGQTEKLAINYKPAKHYPLDVYYLMDASYTMKDSITLLKNQGKKIFKNLNNFTNNVRLGVGSFIEKAALPFADPLNPKHNAYAFKHHLNLISREDEAKFKDVLEKVARNTGANFEAPEAGLDALMQVMACSDTINWRKDARKIIVLCTDATYHSAGDGKIAGAAKLNDMKCHLDNNGHYTLELEQDYPTVNQIRKIAKQENIIVIFNVKNRVIPEYKALAERLDIGAEVIVLEKDSNIDKMIADVYTRKLASIKMDVLRPSNVRVTLTPDCSVPDTCKVAHASDNLIQVSVTAESCLNKYANNTITIKPDNLPETVTITIETLCECECERKSKPNALDCSRNGSLVCGICECNPNHYGDTCDCIGSSMEHLEKCKRHPEDTVVCEGVGTCTCGICNCGPLYSGKFCEHDNNACPRPKGDLCSGNGICWEGSCQCFAGYSGSGCECTSDVKDCRTPYSGKVCSGNGKCECGACNCTTGYYGAYCDDCQNCDENRCKELETYVLCVFNNETKKVCDEKLNTKNTEVLYVNKTEINAPKYHLAKRCTILREDGKSIVFKHKYDTKTLNIIIQKELEEPDRANMWITIGSAIGAILLIGLLTVLLWKCCMDMYDAREYKRFNKMLDESGDGGNINDIYKAPTAKFSNPMFNRQSRVMSMIR